MKQKHPFSVANQVIVTSSTVPPCSPPPIYKPPKPPAHRPPRSHLNRSERWQTRQTTAEDHSQTWWIWEVLLVEYVIQHMNKWKYQYKHIQVALKKSYYNRCCWVTCHFCSGVVKRNQRSLFGWCKWAELIQQSQKQHRKKPNMRPSEPQNCLRLLSYINKNK